MSGDWPNDVDGDVMRRLRDSGFDFATPAQIDFNIDFENGVPDRSVSRLLERELPAADISFQADYVLVQIVRPVSYEFVTSMQAKLTALTAEYGGVCESWGVMQTPSH